MLAIPLPAVDLIVGVRLRQGFIAVFLISREGSLGWDGWEVEVWDVGCEADGYRICSGARGDRCIYLHKTISGMCAVVGPVRNAHLEILSSQTLRVDLDILLDVGVAHVLLDAHFHFSMVSGLGC